MYETGVTQELDIIGNQLKRTTLPAGTELTPTRDFLFVEDAARGIVDAAKNYDDDVPLNLGSSEEISINYLAKQICEILDYEGEIVWNESKPNGQPRRCVSFDRAKGKINFEPKTSFNEGLKQTIDWFVSSQD